MRKRIIYVFISLCMIIALVTYVSAEELYALQEDEAFQENEELFMERQGESLTTYFVVKDELLTDKETFGGVYIDDNGNLNIMIANCLYTEETLESPKMLSEANRLVKDYQDIVDVQKTEEQNVIYHIVTYSLDYLEAVQTDLMDNAESLNIVSSYIDETRNIIVIGYSEDTFDESFVISFVGDDKLLTFEKTEGAEDTAVIKNGSSAKDSSGSFSITCGAKLGNDFGFITAGHCGGAGDKVYSGSDCIGTITKSVNSGSVDAAFIKRSSSNIKSTTKFTDNTAYKSGISNNGTGARNVVGSWPTGTSVIAYGATSSKSSGKITSTKYSTTIISSGKKFTNLVLIDCKSYAGDSGGAIKAIVTNNGLTTAYLCGIIKGGPVGGGVGMFYTDIILQNQR